ncbi:MAG: ABC transporter permease subunit [Acidobacteriota bacterium]
MRGRDRWILMVLGVWVLAPIGLLTLRALTPSWRYPQILPDATGVSAVLAGMSEGRLKSAAVTSLWLAFATGVTGTGLGFLIARMVTRAGRRLRRATLALALFSVIAPPLALGVGLQVVLLSLGFGGSRTGVFLAHLVPATGYLTLFAAGVFASMDRSVEDEARTLGASRRQVWTRVLLPLLRRRLIEGLMLGGLVSWGQLAITLLIGGGVVRTLPVEVLSLVRSGNDQLGSVAALALSVPPMLAIGLLTAGARRTGAVV